MLTSASRCPRISLCVGDNLLVLCLRNNPATERILTICMGNRLCQGVGLRFLEIPKGDRSQPGCPYKIGGEVGLIRCAFGQGFRHLDIVLDTASGRFAPVSILSSTLFLSTEQLIRCSHCFSAAYDVSRFLHSSVVTTTNNTVLEDVNRRITRMQVENLLFNLSTFSCPVGGISKLTRC